MSQDMMKIPKKLNVGFQERKDTYTGKLAYVVYTDEKGVLRKEASWNSWRDKKIEPETYDNVPTSGFVMNKKVGDYKSDWNHRKAHIRIYDPRGFEFEIGVENLLYILEECSSIKGKGLEGEFVYAWDKADLVLLPVTSQEYVSSSKFTNMQTNKVGKKDVVEGCIYINKKMQEVMYLGHHEVFEFEKSNRLDGSEMKITQHKSDGKKHVFMFVNPNEVGSWRQPDKYWYQTGFTKLASKVSDVVSTNFAEEYDIFKKSIYGNKCKIVELEPYKIKTSQLEKSFHSSIPCFMNESGKTKYVNISKKYNTENTYEITDSLCDVKIEGETVIETYRHRENWGYSYNYNYDRKPLKITTLEQLLEMEFFKLTFKNEYNKTIEFFTYY